ncbi:MAG: tripartite tricarboxylate transporter substrate-binding protein [Acetobacteraceae bacterium]|nr:tripartite tricarboxylate transporter substrate-binding protein [Acetobacteraceae bacterium]
MTTRRTLLAALPALPLAPAARAQAPEPLRQATIVVAFPAGGATDVAARLVAEVLRGGYAATVVVENRTGAGGRLGTESVARAPADGSVLLYTPAFPLLIFPHIYRALSYDSLRDFAPVATTTRSVLSISVGPAVPAEVRTLPGFIAWCRANPARALFAAPPGSAQHFAGARLAAAAGVELTMVAYRGGAPAIADLIGGHVPASINPLAEALPHAQRGAIRLLATFGAQRSRFAPDTPTAAESGFPGVVFQDWAGVLGPAGMPPARIQRASELIGAYVRSPAGAEAFARLGWEPEPRTPAEFAEVLRDDWRRYGEIVRATGFVAED